MDLCIWIYMVFQIVLVVKNPPSNAGDVRDIGLIPGLGRSPGGGHAQPLWYSCLENPMDRGAWQAKVHRVTKKQLCTHTCIPCSTLATWCKLKIFLKTFFMQIFMSKLFMQIKKKKTHCKRPWCWERLKAKGEEGNRGWDGWMASPIQWTWVWANSGR